jgi:hypothetical protein
LGRDWRCNGGHRGSGGRLRLRIRSRVLRETSERGDE